MTGATRRIRAKVIYATERLVLEALLNEALEKIPAPVRVLFSSCGDGLESPDLTVILFYEEAFADAKRDAGTGGPDLTGAIGRGLW